MTLSLFTNEKLSKIEMKKILVVVILVVSHFV